MYRSLLIYIYICICLFTDDTPPLLRALISIFFQWMTPSPESDIHTQTHLVREHTLDTHKYVRPAKHIQTCGHIHTRTHRHRHRHRHRHTFYLSWVALEYPTKSLDQEDGEDSINRVGPKKLSRTQTRQEPNADRLVKFYFLLLYLHQARRPAHAHEYERRE